jgi:hypothetical protein
VRICLEHNELLIDSKVRLGLSHHGALRCDATRAIIAPHRNRSPTLSDRDRQTLRLIAQRCSELLVGEETEWRGADLPKVYRSAALERGLGNIGTDLSASAVESAISLFYSVKVLKLIGCGAEGIRAINWWRKLFGVGATYRGGIHPLQHVLMQVLLEHTDKVLTVSLPRSLGQWKCPNPFATHTTPYPAHQYSAGVRKCGKFITSMIWAKCDCGYDFSFRSTSDTDPLMPIPIRVGSRGACWMTHAQNLRREGRQIKDIAKQMYCSPKVVTRALLKESEDDPVLQTEVFSWREQWHDLYHSGPVKSSQLAKIRNPSLHHKLSTYDRPWLMEFQKRESYNRKKEGVNWLVRDKEWAQALQTAINRIAIEQRVPAVRLQDIWILAGVPTLSASNRLDKLPSCAALLRRHGFCGGPLT